MKPQAVRIADVVLIGPLMIWAGLRLRDDYPAAGGLLAALGGATVVYNGRNWYKIHTGEYIEGGAAAGMRADSFEPDELRLGIAEEMEHTADPAIAQEIALDHLAEDPRYYSKLKAAGL